MTNSNNQSFELQEVIDLFHIDEEDCKVKDCDAVLKRINELTEKYGRDYVIKKIALNCMQ